jgi:aldehyde:ferredoxin oxidoreductase
MNHRAAATTGPRVVSIRVEQGGVHSVVSTFSSEVAHLDGLGSLGGSGLALALLSSSSKVKLALAVGSATVRGLPSSGRLNLAGVSPLTGLLAEASLGGEAARCLAELADGLVIEGEVLASGHMGSGGAPRLLCIDAVEDSHGAGVIGGPGRRSVKPRVRLLAFDVGAGGLRKGCRAAALEMEAEVPGSTVALLEIGPAGFAASPMALISTGVSPMSSAGRGGLGARLGELGLAGIAIRGSKPSSAGAAASPAAPGSGSSARKSPRLQERSRGGTLELFQAFAARGELSGRNYSEALGPHTGARLSAEADAMQVERHGCRGCPTPCGLVFERKGGKRSGARFSAAWALGPNVGLDGFESALELLELCDELGLDAREAGACLALLALDTEAHPKLEAGQGDEPGVFRGIARFGDLASLKRALAKLPPMGSAQLAEQLNLSQQHFQAQGAAARPELNLASTLGQCVSTGGNDPMRVFPFLVVPRSGAGGGACALPDGTPLPEGAFDPRNPAGKGSVVAWHEDLAAALDITGFCSFSTAGLIVDAAMDLESLAQWIGPANLVEKGRGRPWAMEEGSAPQLLAAGRALVLARRLANEHLLAGQSPNSQPDWAAEDLALPGMADEYATVRGLDDGGRLLSATRSWMEAGGSDSTLDSKGESRAQQAGSSAPEQAAPTPPKLAPAIQPATAVQPTGAFVTLGSIGPLSVSLGGGDVVIGMADSIPLRGLLERCAELHQDAGRYLFSQGKILPTVWRNGQSLGPLDLVHPGERLDLVLVLAGG